VFPKGSEGIDNKITETSYLFAVFSGTFAGTSMQLIVLPILGTGLVKTIAI